MWVSDISHEIIACLIEFNSSVDIIDTLKGYDDTITDTFKSHINFNWVCNHLVKYQELESTWYLYSKLNDFDSSP